MYFYCLKPEDMNGDKLLPLSSLNDSSHREKYDNREQVTEKIVTPLNCSWDDVVFFSSLNPVQIFHELKKLGLLDRQQITILQFPASVLSNLAFCIYVEGHDGEEFSEISPESYIEIFDLPDTTRNYFENCKHTGEDPLIFFGVPHVLVKGEVAISDAEEIVFKY